VNTSGKPAPFVISGVPDQLEPDVLYASGATSGGLHFQAGERTYLATPLR
jgi:hypothetical protein